jgi:hypothetical protein
LRWSVRSRRPTFDGRRSQQASCSRGWLRQRVNGMPPVVLALPAAVIFVRPNRELDGYRAHTCQGAGESFPRTSGCFRASPLTANRCHVAVCDALPRHARGIRKRRHRCSKRNRSGPGSRTDERDRDACSRPGVVSCWFNLREGEATHGEHPPLSGEFPAIPLILRYSRFIL